MLISIVTETFWPEVNGVAMTLHRLTTGLAERGHQIQVVCPNHMERQSTKLPPNISIQTVKGFPIPGYSVVKLGFPSRKILKNLWFQARPDIIYVATEGPLGWFAVKEANKQGIPVISGFHTNFHSYSQHYRMGFFKKIVEKYLVTIHNKTNLTIVPTPAQKDMLHKMGITDVTVMGRGVDTGIFSPRKRDRQLREQWGVTNNDLVMLYVGRIAEEKNLALTIKTYHALHEANNRLKFVLVGDGPLLKYIQKIHPDFIFAGTRVGEDLAKYYASCDIFVFSSVTETFGNVVLEAMASGLAVFAYDYAAARLHIESYKNGLLTKLNDVDAFVNNAINLIRNDLLLKKIRTSASTHALQHNWSRIVDQFECIMEQRSNNRGNGQPSGQENIQEANSAGIAY